MFETATTLTFSFKYDVGKNCLHVNFNVNISVKQRYQQQGHNGDVLHVDE